MPTFPWTEFFTALGYERIHAGRILPNGQIIFVDGEVCRTSGRPEVWVIIVDSQRPDAAPLVKDEQTHASHADDEDADPFKYLTLYDADKVLGMADLASGKQVLALPAYV